MMDHPNIARILDAGETVSGRPYFVMELVNGVPVTNYCDTYRLTTRERLELFIPIAHGVQHAHQKGIIHRDLKPSNVLVTLQDGKPVPKIIDFGIAKATQGRLTDRTLFTQFQQMIGTPLYMSPEQAEMSGLDIDSRSDIYSLGVILFELLTGTTPLDPTELRRRAYVEMQRAIREVEPPLPSARVVTLARSNSAVAEQRRTDFRQLTRTIRGDLDWVVTKCLEKDRTRRYESASSLASDLSRYLADEPVSAARPSNLYRLKKYVRRHRVQVAVVSVVLFSLVGGVAASTYGLIRAVRAGVALAAQSASAKAERDHARRAETDARAQQAAAERSAHLAKVEAANSLISAGDAYTSGGNYAAAYERYRAAERSLVSLGERMDRLDVSLLRLYRTSPPPLWTIQLPRQIKPAAWGVSRRRNELIASCGDKQCRIYDVVDGTPIRAFPTPFKVRTLVIDDRASTSPRLIVGGKNDLAVLDAVTGEVLSKINDDRASGVCVISADGQLAASTSAKGDAIRFWRTGDLSILSTVHCDQPVTALAFSRDGTRVAAVNGRNDRIQIYSPGDGRVLFETRADLMAELALLPGWVSVVFADDTTLALGNHDGGLAVVKTDGTIASYLRTHSSWVGGVAASNDGRRVMTCSDDGTVNVSEHNERGQWESTLSVVANPAVTHHLELIEGTGGAPVGTQIPTNAQDDGVAIALFDDGAITAWPLVPPIRRPNHLTMAMCISRDGLVCGGRAAHSAEVRDALTDRTLLVSSLHTSCNASAISPDGRRFHLGFDDGVLQTFDLPEARCTSSLQAHNQKIWSIEYSSDGAILATACGDFSGKGDVRAWDAKSMDLLRTLHVATTGMSSAHVLSKTGRPLPTGAKMPASPLADYTLIATGGDDGTIYSWDLGASSPPRRGFAGAYLRGSTITPDGRSIIVSAVQGDISVFDVDALQRKRVFVRYAEHPYSICLADVSGNGSANPWLGLVAYGNGLRFVDITTGQPVLATSESGRFFLNALAGTPDCATAVVSAYRAIDFRMSSRYRDLLTRPDLVRRAQWYADWGLWEWTRILLRRQNASTAGDPALLRARAEWMCGDEPAARLAFARAVALGQCPDWYAALCLSTIHGPRQCLPPQPKSVAADAQATVAAEPLPNGVIAAADLEALRAKIGSVEEVQVQGLVNEAHWSKQGKHLDLIFAGGGGKPGIVCEIVRKDREAFDHAFGGDAANEFAGKRLIVRGRVVPYTGKNTSLRDWPQMVLEDPAQVKVLRQ